MSAIDGKILLTNNDCYKKAQKMTPKGIVVHSTGANNPNIKRYVQPDDGVIGNNANNNDWNRGGLDVCVHGFIGKDKSGNVKFYQTLPFDYCCWGVGSGSKGSYNYNPAYIQFEMCEDDLSDKDYCKKCYNKAVEVCAYLCEKYNISVNNIVSHKEAGVKGYGSKHIDPANWWDKFGYTMDGFRTDVKNKLNGKSTTTANKVNAKPASAPKPTVTTTKKVSYPTVTYKVRTGGKWLPEVKNLEDYAGIKGQAITDIAIKVGKGSVKYRVHIKGGNWLPYVTGYDTSDHNNGYAGNGKVIDAIEVYYNTPSDLKNSLGYYLKAKYRVSPAGGNYYSYQYDNEKGNGQDGYAGAFGKSIDRVQIVLAK